MPSAANNLPQLSPLTQGEGPQESSESINKSSRFLDTREWGSGRPKYNRIEAIALIAASILGIIAGGGCTGLGVAAGLTGVGMPAGILLGAVGIPLFGISLYGLQIGISHLIARNKEASQEANKAAAAATSQL